jgi:hypothetical protein
MKAEIVNTKGWVNHWFEEKEGEIINVEKYPHKGTKCGVTTYCNCFECEESRRGYKLYNMFAITEKVGNSNIGSIIPECCLKFKITK